MMLSRNSAVPNMSLCLKSSHRSFSSSATVWTFLQRSPETVLYPHPRKRSPSPRFLEKGCDNRPPRIQSAMAWPYPACPPHTHQYDPTIKQICNNSTIQTLTTTFSTGSTAAITAAGTSRLATLVRHNSTEPV